MARPLNSEKLEKTIGLKGVMKDKTTGKYVANVYYRGRIRYIGKYVDPKDAYRAFFNEYKRVYEKDPFPENLIEKTSLKIECENVSRKYNTTERSIKADRICMKCGNKFPSRDKFHRICDLCKKINSVYD